MCKSSTKDKAVSVSASFIFSLMHLWKYLAEIFIKFANLNPNTIFSMQCANDLHILSVILVSNVGIVIFEIYLWQVYIKSSDLAKPL